MITAGPDGGAGGAGRWRGAGAGGLNSHSVPMIRIRSEAGSCRWVSVFFQIRDMSACHACRLPPCSLGPVDGAGVTGPKLVPLFIPLQQVEKANPSHSQTALQSFCLLFTVFSQRSRHIRVITVNYV